MRLIKKMFMLGLVFVFICPGFAEIKDISKEDWAGALLEIGVKAEESDLEHFIESKDSLVNISRQTKGNLKLDNWIQIFKKLNIEPKKNMTVSDWRFLINSVGINFIDELKDIAQMPDKSSEIGQEMKNEVSYIKEKPGWKEGLKVGEYEQAELPQKQEKRRSYPKISLDFKGMDIHSTLKVISQKSGLNIVTGKDVRGKVDIYITDIDAFEALCLILEMNDLAYIEEDNIIKVITVQDYEKIYGEKFYNRTIVEMIKLKHVKADDIINTISSLKSRVGQIAVDKGTNSLFIIDTPQSASIIKKYIQELDEEKETGYFSLNYADPKEIEQKLKGLWPTTEIKIDERNNKVIITDMPDKIDKISKLIESYDERPKEVLIEAKIVQIRLNDDIKMGVNWQSVFNSVGQEAMPGKVIGNMGNLTSLPPVSLGTAGVQLSVGTLEVNNFNAVFDLLQTVGKTNLVSSPRIATLENKEAKILVGTKEAYVTSQITNPGTATSSPIVSEDVQFIDVGIKLFVTPMIADDGFVTMKIRPEVSSVDRTINTAQGNTIPIVRTSESETNVMVKDGITIVIAGLIEEKELRKFEGVPLLCRVPLLGSFFRRTTKEKVKTELVVFLTPRIMTGDS